MLQREAKIETSGGIGFLGLLTLLFITLKLTEVIDWSWWWVLGPLWIPWAALLGVVACVLLSIGCAFLFVGIFVVSVAAFEAWFGLKK